MLRRLPGQVALGALVSISISCGMFGDGRPGRGEVELNPPGAGTDQRPLPTGRVVLLNDDVPCAANALDAAKCSRLEVRCPGVPDLNAEIAVTKPTGPSRGTLVAHRGADGMEYFHQPDTLRRIADAGFTVVQVRWQSDWETTPRNGILKAACRPATVFRWVQETIHGGSRDTGFCALGHSAGGGAISYYLAHYGGGQQLDYAAIAAGPPFGRIDFGCAPKTYDGPPRRICGLDDAPMDLPPALVDPWDNTWTCGNEKPHPDDIARWKADSVVSPDADFRYPSTRVDFFDCGSHSNGTLSGAFFYSSAIESENNVVCFTDECWSEDLGDAGWARVVKDITEQCLPRHRG